ncbi:MAG: localization factor PodJL [Methylobacteriaceae bacterium]|nr:localization factor PodJL [Methylobacteriaceae bacterium]
MNKAASWSIKGVDFDAREAAEVAAQRSGLSLGEWLNNVIAERAAEQQVEPADLDTDERLEAVTARLQRLSQGEPRDRRRKDSGMNLPLGERRRSDSPMRERPKQVAIPDEEADEPAASRKSREIAFGKDRDSEALLDQAIAAFERRAHAAQRQTANALADVNEWMEESRSHRKRDREMLSTVADRLANIEERVASRPQEDSFAPVRDAISRLEERFEALSRPAPAPPVLETTLRDLDEKMNALAARMDRPRPQPAPIPEPPPAPAPQRPVIHLQTRGVGDAVAEIVRRRNHLEGVSHAPIILAQSGFDQRLEAITKRLEEAADHASGRQTRESAALEGLQKEVASLASQLEHMRDGGGPDDPHTEALKAGERSIGSLREEIAAMSRAVSQLAPRGAVDAIDLAIRELTLKLEASRMNGARDAVLAPIEQLASDLREALAAFDPRVIVERLENEIRSIARKLESFQASGGIDPEAFNRICEQTREVRDLLTAASSRPLPVEKIEQQVNALAQRLDALPMMMPRGEGGDLAPSLGEIRALIADAEAPAFKSLQSRLETLSDKFDDVATRAQHPSEFGELSKRLDFMHEALSARIADASPRNSSGEAAQLETMMRALAEKLETALVSRSDGAHEALERQIELLSQRLDKSDRSLASISSLDKSIGDLFEQLEDTRRAAVDAAEDAARQALRNAMPDIAQPLSKELSRELADLRSAQDVADQRLHATLTAVHDTLEKVVDRLSLLEDDVANGRASPEDELLAAGAPPIFAPARRNDEPKPAPAGVRLRAARESRGDNIPSAPRVSDDADFLIEPGSGFRPGGDNERKSSAQNLQGGAPSQANFIAAARRAVAAAQAADTQVQAQGEKRRAAAKNGAAKAGVLSRFTEARAALNTRKRPLLLGLAGLVLLLAAYQVLRMGGNDVPAPNAKIEMPADTKPRAQSANPAPKADMTPTQTFAASKPVQPQLATPLAPPPKAEPAAAPPASAAKTDPAPVSAITQSPPSMVGSTGAQPKDNIAGLQSLAVTGDASAQYELGQRYAEGRTVTRDPKLATQWFEKAANQGLAPAQYRMGSAYEKGIGVTRDLNLSKMWYQRAADSGNVRAMHNLAVLIAEGTDGKPDYPGAANWFKQGAEYGVRDSQFNLAILYARGLGVGQNLVQSYVWFTLAAKQGDEDAGKKAQDVAARLDAKDLATAKSLAESFRAKTASKTANEVAAPGTNWEGVKPPIGADLKSTAPKISRL